MLRWTLLFFIIAVGVNTSEGRYAYEKSLVQDLIKHYDYDARPLKDKHKAVSISLQMIIQRISVSETTHRLTIDCWMPIMWKNEWLTWDPKKNNGTQRLKFSRYQIWQPELYLNQDKCMAKFDGVTVCIPYVTHEAMCVPDARRWPYDYQNCTLTFGSWVDNDEQLNLTLADVPIIDDEYQENREWYIWYTHIWKSPGKTLLFDETYTSLHFSFLLMRKGSSFTNMVLIPAIGFTFLTIGTAFLSPGVLQIGTAMMSLFAQMFYLIQIYWLVPAHGHNIPYIVMLFRDSVVIATVILLVSMVMMALTKLKQQPPKLVYTVINIAKTSRAKIVTFAEFDPDKVVSNETESGENFTKDQQQTLKTANSDWKMFASIFSNLFFIMIICIYMFLIIMYC